jgi:predicted transposase YdaD
MDYTELQDTIQQVLMKGFLKGFKEGMKESKLEIAKSMLKKNFHVSFIEQMTGINAECLEKLSLEL